MAPLNVTIKHAGKTYPIQLDTSEPPIVFKNAIYQATGVPVDRMKVMTKAGVLKDDTDWKKVAPKEGGSFMVVGSAGELPKAPEKPIVFLEDMNEAEANAANAVPVGLANLGNTCYMNSTIQCLRAIPELHTALNTYEGTGSVQMELTSAMRDLYSDMGESADGFPPFMFLQLLRTMNPQFAEQERGHYSQQDADECWISIVNALSQASLRAAPSTSASAPTERGFVDAYLSGETTTELKCDEAPDEPPTIQKEKILKLDCNISITTNYMHTGIADSFNQKIEKNSPTLGRQAVYSQTTKISRLPVNLTVHMVRFYWRADINKKAKIMRKVKFPFELDVTDLVTDELKAKLLPLNRQLKLVEKARDERRKIRSKSKAGQVGDSNPPSSEPTPMAVDEATGEAPAPVVDEGVGPEGPYREKELAELEALVDPALKEDLGSSPHGLYELCGIVTHKGASADGGHYIGWVKKTSLTPQTLEDGPLKEEWYKFDDDKVSIVDQDKIVMLDGGGQDSTAYILLYRSKSLA